MGHVLQGQAGRYGKRPEHEQQDMQLLAVRNHELQKLHLPGLDLDHLRVATNSASAVAPSTSQAFAGAP